MFARPLDLDELMFCRHHHITIYLGTRILFVAEIEQQVAVDDANAYSRYRRAYRMSRQQATLHQQRTGAMQGDISTSDRGRACATIGLQHITIKRDRAWTERLHVNGGTE